MNHPYISPPPHTPINIKVHKHLKWNKSLYPPQFIPSNSIQLPDFPHIHHSKFLLQYCYYLDGSFIPPKQITNVIWDPTRAGYSIWNPLFKINVPQRLIGL
jgi:hypothetical protein